MADHEPLPAPSTPARRRHRRRVVALVTAALVAAVTACAPAAPEAASGSGGTGTAPPTTSPRLSAEQAAPVSPADVAASTTPWLRRPALDHNPCGTDLTATTV